MVEDYNNSLEDDGPSSRTSKINAAALINLILADLWKDSYRHSRQGEFAKWNADLNCIWIELAGDVKEGEKPEINFNKLDEELAKAGSLNKQNTGGFKVTAHKDLLNYAKQYQLLLKKAVFLKRLQNSQGKGTAYRDESDDYMD